MWKSDSCYADWGVDGSDCTIYHYLSQVEHWCPPTGKNINSTKSVRSKAKIMKQNFTELFKILGRDIQYKWIKMRMRRMQGSWLEAAQSLAAKFDTGKWKKKKASETGFKIADNAFKGGPLGELVQWSDLISALYVLGHEIKVTNSVEQLTELFTPFLSSASSNCPIQAKPYDILYTDISGLKFLKHVAGNKFHLLQCEIRVVDSFGTEPEFNHAVYAGRKQHSSQWGKWNFNPKQFNTMFRKYLLYMAFRLLFAFRSLLVLKPGMFHVSSLYEVLLLSLPKHINSTLAATYKKENISLTFGILQTTLMFRITFIFQGKEEYINAIHEVSPVHATVETSEELNHVPPFVINHGVLPGFELHALLQRTKVFVGMGFPYEGPAPLEAIANGAVYLNVRFSKSSPLYEKAASFFKVSFFTCLYDRIKFITFFGKPTSRKLTSQHPYTSTFIGRHCLDQGCKYIFSIVHVEPYMPYEFTCLGMLERLGLLVEKQDFCQGDESPIWPPVAALQTVQTDDQQSCMEACTLKGLICEPAYFPYINLHTHFAKEGITCDTFKVPDGTKVEIDFPAHADGTCYIQSDPLLYSCAGRYTTLLHICPCRNYIKGQVALCKDCL
uniref:alpha-1,6-mannosyl-glycoprotein 6-beta-N-acetylglucosaminyltransferase n=1 Tax=Ciona savignyi TaxID=51511 RepID=H2YVL1_CIOSA